MQECGGQDKRRKGFVDAQTADKEQKDWRFGWLFVEWKGKRLSLAGRARGKGAGRLWEGGTQKKESLGMLRPVE